MSSSYDLEKELKFREVFQNAIRKNYQQIIQEFVRNPDNFNYFTRELFENRILDFMTKESLLDSSRDREGRAEKLVQHIGLSSASSMRIFIRLFKQNSHDIYYDIVSNNKNKIDTFEKIELEFFGENSHEMVKNVFVFTILFFFYFK
jgi:hypothetical protein